MIQEEYLAVASAEPELEESSIEEPFVSRVFQLAGIILSNLVLLASGFVCSCSLRFPTDGYGNLALVMLLIAPSIMGVVFCNSVHSILLSTLFPFLLMMLCFSTERFWLLPVCTVLAAIFLLPLLVRLRWLQCNGRVHTARRLFRRILRRGLLICLVLILATTVKLIGFLPSLGGLLPVQVSAGTAGHAKDETEIYALDQLASQYPAVGLFMDEEAWEAATERERVEAISAALDLGAAYLGIETPSANIVEIEAETTVTGRYESQTNTVFIDRKHYQESSPEALMKTVFHELYHSYEEDLVRCYANLELNEPAAKLLVHRRILEYKYDIVHYKNGSDGDLQAYYTQPLERDARQFAASMVFDLFLCYGHTPRVS